MFIFDVFVCPWIVHPITVLCGASTNTPFGPSAHLESVYLQGHGSEQANCAALCHLHSFHKIRE
jgi:hypothetical protein